MGAPRRKREKCWISLWLRLCHYFLRFTLTFWFCVLASGPLPCALGPCLTSAQARPASCGGFGRGGVPCVRCAAVKYSTNAKTKAV